MRQRRFVVVSLATAAMALSLMALAEDGPVPHPASDGFVVDFRSVEAANGVLLFPPEEPQLLVNVSVYGATQPGLIDAQQPGLRNAGFGPLQDADVILGIQVDCAVKNGALGTACEPGAGTRTHRTSATTDADGNATFIISAADIEKLFRLSIPPVQQSYPGVPVHVWVESPVDDPIPRTVEILVPTATPEPTTTVNQHASLLPAVSSYSRTAQALIARGQFAAADAIDLAVWHPVPLLRNNLPVPGFTDPVPSGLLPSTTLPPLPTTLATITSAIPSDPLTSVPGTSILPTPPDLFGILGPITSAVPSVSSLPSTSPPVPSGLPTGVPTAGPGVSLLADHVDLTAASADWGSGTDRTFTATLKDTSGQTVPDNTAIVQFGTAGTGTGTVTGLEGGGQVTASMGVATITLTGLDLGAITITAEVETATNGTQTAQVAVTLVVGPPDAAMSIIEADGSSLVADGLDATTITVTAKDPNGHNLGDGGAILCLTSNRGTLTGNGTCAEGVQAIDNENGTYEAILTAGTAPGLATITGTLDGTTLSENASVVFVPGAADAAHSLLETQDATLVANGTDSTLVVVTARDAYNNSLAAGGATVCLFTDRGTLEGDPAQTLECEAGETLALDNGDGTYEANLASATTAGAATIGGTLDAGPLTPREVVFEPGPVVPGNGLIEAVATELVADGQDSTVIAVTARDANGNANPAGGATVCLATTAGTVTGDPDQADECGADEALALDNGDGTYTATLTSSTSPAFATVSGTYDEVPIIDNATVRFAADGPSPDESLIEAEDATITADGASTTTITVRALDADSNLFPSGGSIVCLTSDLGALAGNPEQANECPAGASLALDNDNGTYTATLTAGTLAGTATITGTLNGTTMPDTATVDFVPGPADAAQSLLEAQDATLVANGTDSTVVVVTARDAHGNLLPTGGAIVCLSIDLGTLDGDPAQTTECDSGDTLALDNGDGDYTATLTSATTAGIATLNGTLAGVNLTQAGTVTFVPGPASAAQSALEAANASLTADGAEQTTVTFTALDAYTNEVGAGGATVCLATDAGTLTGDPAQTDECGTGQTLAIDAGDGTYTATLTSGTTMGAAIVSAVLDGVAVVDTAGVQFVPGPADGAWTTIHPGDQTLVANGTDTTSITVTALDANGNLLTIGGATVCLATTAGNLTGDAASVDDCGAGEALALDNGDGTYTANLTSGVAAGTATVTGTLGQGSIADNAVVDFIHGAPAAIAALVEKDDAVANGTDPVRFRVVVTDAHGNLVPGSTVSAEVEEDLQDLATGDTALTGPMGQAIFWANSTRGGAHPVSFSEPDAGFAVAVAHFVGGPAVANHSQLTLQRNTLTANGSDQTTVTVLARDVYDNRAPGGGSQVCLATDLGQLLGEPDPDAVCPAGHVLSMDQADGSYTAILRSGAANGTANLTGTLNGTAIGQNASVIFIDGPLRLDAPGEGVWMPNLQVTLRFDLVPASDGDPYDTQCVIDDNESAAFACADGQSVAFPADGAHNLTLRAQSENATHTVQRVVLIDSTPPVAANITSTTHPPAPLCGSSRTASFAWQNASDATSGLGVPPFKYRLNTGNLTNASQAAAGASGLGDGAHTLSVTVYDAAGHSASSSYPFRVDTQPPSVAITGPGAARGPFAINWTASDACSGIHSYTVEQRRGSGAWSPLASAEAGNGNATLSPTGNDAVYAFRARAQDVLGHEGEFPAQPQLTVFYDTTPPDAAVNVTAASLADGGIRVAWDPAEDADGSGVVGYRVSRASSAAGPFLTVSTQTVAGDNWTDHVPAAQLGAVYWYKVRAVDLAGNEGEPSSSAWAPAVASAGMDAAPPDVATTIAQTLGVAAGVQIWAVDTDGDGLPDGVVSTDPTIRLGRPVELADGEGGLLIAKGAARPTALWLTATGDVYPVAPRNGTVTSSTQIEEGVAVTILTQKQSGWIDVEVEDAFPGASLLRAEASDGRVIPLGQVAREDGRLWLLDDPDVEYRLIYAPDSGSLLSTSGDATPWVGWAVAGLGVLLVVVVAALTVTVIRRRRAPAPEGEAPQPDAAAEAEPTAPFELPPFDEAEPARDGWSFASGADVAAPMALPELTNLGIGDGAPAAHEPGPPPEESPLMAVVTTRAPVRRGSGRVRPAAKKRRR